MKFGIIKERKNPPDKRVVFSPEKLLEFRRNFPEASFAIESSNIRIFPDIAYQKAGFIVTDDLSDCDVLLGVKEVPIEALIPNKKYFFFSHTIKKQPYNRELLRAILKKNIQLFDHEAITNTNGERLIGFGRYAGIVGAYNGFRAYGLKNASFQIPKANTLGNRQGLIDLLSTLKLPTIKILLTGKGNVARGAREMLEGMKLRAVPVTDYLHRNFNEPVYCQIDALDYNKRRDGQMLGKADFYKNPSEYETDFMRFARVTDYFIAGHFFGKEAPALITKEAAKRDDFKISVIADISCDINGPIASTLRASTIAAPFYGYDPKSATEVDFKDPGAITVMAVDNLPCELPKDASEGFGTLFLNHVIPAFFNKDKDGVLARAEMTHKKRLTKNFEYLLNYVAGKE